MRLREHAAGAALTELFRPTAASLRFRLGTSLADLRVPFHLDPSLRHLVHRATIDAYLLVAQRHKPSIAPAEYDRLVVVEGFDPSALRPLSFQPPAAVSGAITRRLFLDVPEQHVGVDAGLVASFFGTGRPGRALSATLHRLFVKARDEARRSDEGEPTPYLVALVVRHVAAEALTLIQSAPIGEPMSRFVRTAVGTLLEMAARLALRDSGLLRAAARASATGDPREERTGLLTAAALGLPAFLGRRVAMSGSGLAAYGVVFDATPPRLDEALVRLSQGELPDELTRELATTSPRDVQRRLERAGALAQVRDLLRALARRGASLAFDTPLERLLLSPNAVERTFGQEARRRDLAKAARDAARTAGKDDVRELWEAVAHAAREWHDDEPAAWLGPTEARQRAARAVIAMAADTLVERSVQPVMSLLLERTGAETEGGVQAEYLGGRLYLVSAEDTPLLQARLAPPRVAHLFCDMKDFTRRTAFLKESVIADFLRREFYAPILQAASGLDVSARTPEAPRGIQLNNLLGDAVSFSGDVVTLVQLALSVRRQLRDYERRLEQEASQENVSMLVRHLTETFERRRTGLEQTLRDLHARVAREPKLAEPLMSRIDEARSELRRQEALFRADLARAAGEKLEAGVFVSFGAAPEWAAFDDPAFGHIRVAIAEKINESARGTARNAAVRDKVHSALKRARQRTGLPLELAFDVFVDTPLDVPLGPEDAALLADYLSLGDDARAQSILMSAVRRGMERTGPGDIYNAGAAVSEEALRAYLEARADQMLVLRPTMDAAALAAPIRQRFFFPRPRLEMVACVNPIRRELLELYVFQGRAQFRGFEATGGLGIWEAIDAQNPLFQALSQHHLPAWLR